MAIWAMLGLRPTVIVSGLDAATAPKASCCARSKRKVGYDVVLATNESPSSLRKLNLARDTRSASRIPGGGASMRRATRPNIAALVPIASAKVSTTATTNVGSRRSVRTAYLKSRAVRSRAPFNGRTGFIASPAWLFETTVRPSMQRDLKPGHPPGDGSTESWYDWPRQSNAGRLLAAPHSLRS